MKLRLPLIAAIVLALSPVGCDDARAASRPAARGVSGMVVAPEPLAADVGRHVLERGGNAIDAAVATALALAVTYPRAGNLGGGGFALVRLEDGRFVAHDHRETAPRALGPEHFERKDGTVDPRLSVEGGRSIGVPGSVAGLFDLHERFGAMPWPRLVAPAIRLAADGFEISRRTADSLESAHARLVRDPEARRIFTDEGAPLREGSRLVQPDLARTLARIAAEGPSGFYRGPVAESIVRTVRRDGGVMSPEDLAVYRPFLREPVEGTYRGLRVVSFPPPSSGGVVLLQILGMIEARPPSEHGFGASATIHAMAEAERRAYADRAAHLGDPDFVDNPVPALLAADYLAERMRSFDPDRATPSDDVGAGAPEPAESPDTLHLSVADSSGRAVALTTTLNSPYGAAVVATGTGVLLNNEMDDFALAPGVPNQFGLLGSSANAVEGRKRPLSSMTPTIVEKPGESSRPFLVVGSPGGSRIITTVAQVIVNVVDHGMELQEAVEAPRFHHQWKPDRIEHEPRAFPEDVRSALVARGHVLHEVNRPIGIVAAIGIAEDGRWTGAADPRGEGVALGVDRVLEGAREDRE